MHIKIFKLLFYLCLFKLFQGSKIFSIWLFMQKHSILWQLFALDAGKFFKSNDNLKSSASRHNNN